MSKSKIEYLHMGSIPLFLGYAESEVAFKKEMKRMNVKNPPEWVTPGKAGTMHTFVSDSSMDTCIICVRKEKGRRKAELVGLLVHEAEHVLQQIKMTMGEDNMGRETESYLMQWMCQWLVDRAGVV